MKTIDIVIPYVNNKDPLWKKSFLDFASKHGYYGKMASMNGLRYANEFDLIYYQLQLVNKNMPWINKIYLLLASPTQVIKSLLPNNCEIVLHNQFIPTKYLPTFNSCTIEMFLWNIPNLSEYFIYANDDMLPLKPLKPSDFYYDGKIKMSFNNDIKTRESTQYKLQCYNSWHALINKLNYDCNKDYFEYPQHTFTPMILSDCKACFELIKDNVLPNIRAFRNDNQHNQYIYPNYNKLVHGCYPSKVSFYYSSLGEEPQVFEKELKNNAIVCVNAMQNQKNINTLKEYLYELCK